MTEFGLATVFGSVCFCTTFMPAFAYLINFGCKKPRPALTDAEVKQNASLMEIFTRDVSFIIVGMILYYHYMAAESLSLS